MKNKAPIYDVILSGGGPAGGTLALLLADAGLRVALIDPERQERTARPTGRTAALLNGSMDVIKRAGLWDGLQDRATPLRIMRIIDAADMSAALTFHAGDIGEEQFGFNIPNADIKAAAHGRIAAHGNITFLNPDKLSTFRIEGARVIAETESGTSLSAPLIIGTDGRGSRVRTIAKIEPHTHDYGQTAITCLVTHTKPHDFQSTEFHRDSGPFTFVPMAGNMSSVVWVERTDDAKKILGMKKAEFEQAMQDRSQGILGTISLASDPENWPLMLLRTDKITAPRTAIAAEAAHVLSPLGAQGLNLSLRDVAALADTLIDAARLGEDIGGELVLARYESRRRLDLKTRVHGMDAYNRLVAQDISFLQDLRRLGLKGIDRIAPLKQLAMKHGLNTRA